MTIEIADCLFLSRAMGAPVPAGKDPQKWTGAAMANGERRAAGIAHLGALLGQRVPVEREKPAPMPRMPLHEDPCPCEARYGNHEPEPFAGQPIPFHSCHGSLLALDDEGGLPPVPHMSVIHDSGPEPEA